VRTAMLEPGARARDFSLRAGGPSLAAG
jgi:hypothetical protein